MAAWLRGDGPGVVLDLIGDVEGVRILRVRWSPSDETNFGGLEAYYLGDRGRRTIAMHGNVSPVAAVRFMQGLADSNAQRTPSMIRAAWKRRIYNLPPGELEAWSRG